MGPCARGTWRRPRADQARRPRGGRSVHRRLARWKARRVRWGRPFRAAVGSCGKSGSWRLLPAIRARSLRSPFLRTVACWPRSKASRLARSAPMPSIDRFGSGGFPRERWHATSERPAHLSTVWPSHPTEKRWPRRIATASRCGMPRRANGVRRFAPQTSAASLRSPSLRTA